MDLSHILGNWITELENTPQNPQWHGEGDVLRHTQMVCRSLESLDAYQQADEETQTILFLAAALHDLGKITATRQEEGQWVSPGHSRKGAEMARQSLWTDLGLCGTPEKQRLREAVCLLVRYHSVPAYAVSHPDGLRLLRKIAANGEQVPGFCLDWLCTLAQADARGRVCRDQQEFEERVLLCRELAMEAGCLNGPFPFPSRHTGRVYLSGREIPPAYEYYDTTWGEVILLSGLPGTGKDTWIGKHCSGMPVVSLDAIREEQGISPLDNQSRVVDLARNQARELLRQKQPFVWNATNLIPQTRQKQIQLFESYGAAVRIVYLETSWQEQVRRNADRAAAVPENAICHMLEKLSPPEGWEGERVVWQCI